MLALIPSNLHKQLPGAYARGPPKLPNHTYVSSHVNPDFTDPDWLALIFCGLHELNEGDRHLVKAATAFNEQAESASDSDPVARYAPVLDSLACLLVYQPRNQVVAITFFPSSIAANPDSSSSLKNHWQAYLQMSGINSYA